MGLVGLHITQTGRRLAAGLQDVVGDALPGLRAAGGSAQRVSEVKVARLEARRVGVGDVAGDQPLTSGTKDQGLKLKVECVAKARNHNRLLWLYKACRNARR